MHVFASSLSTMRVPAVSVLLLAGLTYNSVAAAITPERRRELRKDTKELWEHGYNSYISHAFPADEIRPISCTPLHRPSTNEEFHLNDILGDYSLTQLDVLSTLPIIAPELFPAAVERVVNHVTFDRDVKVQVFEVTIRVLGALLSTYQTLETMPPDDRGPGKHKAKILAMALDLGERLLPAFETSTGIPYARVNLKNGVEKGESVETCTAGAGSLILEFATLSRVTGDGRFERVAHRAFLSLWNRRSPLNLVSNTLGVTHGNWFAPGNSGIGAGIDSFYEYAIKAGIMLADDAYMDIWDDAYTAVMTHVRSPDGYIFRQVDFRTGQPSSPTTIDSLSAFFPSIQVLAGDIEGAIKSHLVFWNLWRKHSALPESWDYVTKSIVWAGWPGRPEFIESTYYLYRATRDPFYLRVGERVLRDIKTRTVVRCGLATLRNVVTGELEDRMESFMLSETLKYLFLLFDEAADEQKVSNTVFTTEGHPLTLPLAMQTSPSLVRKALHAGEVLQCPAYSPPTLGGLTVGIEGRGDYEYVRHLVDLDVDEGQVADAEGRYWGSGGRCIAPTTLSHSFDIVLTPSESAEIPPEDGSPSPDKVFRIENGDFVIKNITGLRLRVRNRLDDVGYDVTSIGPHRVRSGQSVIIVDPSMHSYIPAPPAVKKDRYDPAEVILRFATLSDNSGLQDGSLDTFLHAGSATATFGRALSQSNRAKHSFAVGGASTLLAPPPLGNEVGCAPHNRSRLPAGSEPFALLLRRGECTFFDKMTLASQAGASAVIIVGYDHDDQVSAHGLIRPSADGEDEDGLLAVEDVAMVYVTNAIGNRVEQQLKRTGETGYVNVLLFEGDTLSPGADQQLPAQSDKEQDTPQIQDASQDGYMAVNGRQIVNLRITHDIHP